MKFREQLRSLGFGSYAEYLQSQHWHEFRARYKANGLRMTCLVCSTGPIQLHHQTYARLGREQFDDVIPVCRTHHVAIHDWLKSSGRLFVEYTREALGVLAATNPPVVVEPSAKSPDDTTRRRNKKRRRKAKKAAERAKQKSHAATLAQRDRQRGEYHQARSANPAVAIVGYLQNAVGSDRR